MVERALDSDEVALADLWDKRGLEQSKVAKRRSATRRSRPPHVSTCCFAWTTPPRAANFEKVDFNALFPAHLAYRAKAAYLLANGRAEKVPGQIIRAAVRFTAGPAVLRFERMLLEKLHLRSLAETYRGGSSPTG